MNAIFNDSLLNIFLLPEWGQLYVIQNHGRAEIFEVKNELGHAFYQFTVRPIPLKFNHTQFYDTITPFGMGGPILSDCLPASSESSKKRGENRI